MRPRGAVYCHVLAVFVAWLGLAIGPQAQAQRLPLTESSCEEYLGEGDFSRRVVRVHKPDGRVVVRKHYKSKDHMLTELASLEWLRRESADLQPPSKLHLVQVLHIDHEQATVEFENLEGTRMFEWLLEQLPSPQKAKVIETYNQEKNRLEQHLMQKLGAKLRVMEIPDERAVNNVRSLSRILENGDFVLLVIRTKNVLVGDDGRISLFDPF